MLEKLALDLLTVSILVGVLVLALTLAAPALRRRYTARTLCAAWLLLAVRLLIPVHFSFAKAPVQVTVPAPQAVVQPAAGQADAAVQPETQDETQLFAAGTQPVLPQENGFAAAPAAKPSFSLRALLTGRNLALLWLAVAACLALYQAAAYLWWRHGMKRKNRVAPAAMRRLWEQQCRGLGIRPLPVYENAAVTSPMVVGFFGPVLMVPCGMQPDAGAALMLLHEAEHVRRHDLWCKLLLQAAVCIHWFNPAVWLLRSQAQQEIEFACDQAVVRRCGLSSREAYGQALLHTSAARAPLPCSQFGGSKAALKRRLKNLYRGGIRRGTALVAALALTAALGGSMVACRWGGADPRQPASGSAAASQPADPAAPFELTDARMDTLMEMCYTVPAFGGPEDIDAAYLRSFLFAAYTCFDMPETVRLEDGTAQIAAADAQARILLTFGVTFDVSALTDAAGQDVSCRYDAASESILVRPSDFGNVSYRFREIVGEGAGYAVTFEGVPGGESEPYWLTTLHLLPADNANGFVITASEFCRVAATPEQAAGDALRLALSQNAAFLDAWNVETIARVDAVDAAGAERLDSLPLSGQDGGWSDETWADALQQADTALVRLQFTVEYTPEATMMGPQNGTGRYELLMLVRKTGESWTVAEQTEWYQTEDTPGYIPGENAPDAAQAQALNLTVEEYRVMHRQAEALAAAGLTSAIAEPADFTAEQLYRYLAMRLYDFTGDTAVENADPQLLQMILRFDFGPTDGNVSGGKDLVTLPDLTAAAAAGQPVPVRNTWQETLDESGLIILTAEPAPENSRMALECRFEPYRGRGIGRTRIAGAAPWTISEKRAAGQA